MSGVKEPQKAVWSTEETDAFVDYLVAHHSEAGDGGNFKTATFTAAAQVISPLLKFGPPKTEKMCKTKWVSLKATYAAIQKYQSTTSGTHWDNENGANIITKADSDVWEGYIKNNSAMKPFRNVGWTYYNRLQIILPNATARGSYAFSASTSTQPISANLNEAVDETGDGLGNVTRSDPFNADEAPLAASTPASTQSNKRRVSALLHDDDVASNDISHSTSASSRKRSRPSGSTFTSHSVSEKSQKLTSTLVLHGMQGSINRLTDTLNDALKPENQDPLYYDKSASSAAISRVQMQDDGLSGVDKADLAILFSENPSAVNAYLQLHDREVRLEYIRKILARFRNPGV